MLSLSSIYAYELLLPPQPITKYTAHGGGCQVHAWLCLGSAGKTAWVCYWFQPIPVCFHDHSGNRKGVYDASDEEDSGGEEPENAAPVPPTIEAMQAQTSEAAHEPQQIGRADSPGLAANAQEKHRQSGQHEQARQSLTEGRGFLFRLTGRPCGMGVFLRLSRRCRDLLWTTDNNWPRRQQFRARHSVDDYALVCGIADGGHADRRCLGIRRLHHQAQDDPGEI